ncbi:SusC/RagA family TonB-linked outer membrane protein [Marinifilum sp. D714]|uniref:SusC/RagA family TonB-linked outer membrane protein n=1 Tax=Marinifilum sp. D714 TaxID=2937523 RepID=UPI0027CCC5CB|nr:SusC/RagA family TonB-linked outer membrane protein [Marinifilum sp. D714]MDQ2178456.1 SusC/RagA family TonB-linked outer membrane protein [Marinifilum sp. D714]
MKLVLFLTLALSLSATAGVFSQNQRVSFEFEDATILEVLNEIKSQTGLSFIYSEEKIQELNRVSVDAAGKTVEEVLNEIFGKSSLECRFQDNVIMVVDKPSEPATKGQQEKKEIKGTVTDDQGVPLPGVSVVIKGTSVGVATDIDGKYAIEVENDNVVLVFSFVGMLPQEVTYKGQTVQNVKLTADSEQMAEVVVTGYQTINRERMTGSAKAITNQAIKNVGFTSVEDALEGSVSGLNVVSSGRPGEDADIQIRGVNSFTGNTNPLWIVDGMPMMGSVPEVSDGNALRAQALTSGIGNVAPEDIESITVLKDAAASAIYGAQAANGVIVITTKSGHSGKTFFNITSNMTITERPNPELFMMNSAEKVEFEKGYYEDWSERPFLGRAADIYRAIENETMTLADANMALDQLRNTNTNWFKEIFKTAISQQHSLSMSGGNEKTQYYVSGNYLSEEGIEPNNEFDKLGLNMKITHNPSEKIRITFGLSTNLRNTTKTASGINPLKYAIYANPYEKPYNEDGTYAYDLTYPASIETVDGKGYFRQFNALEDLKKNTDDSRYISSNMNLKFEYEFLPGLTYTLQGAYNINSNHSSKKIIAGTYSDYSTNGIYSTNWHPESRSSFSYDMLQGSLRESTSRGSEYTLRNTLQFMKEFEGGHYVTLFGGQEIRQTKSNTFFNFSPTYDAVHGIGGYPDLDGFEADRLNLYALGGTSEYEDKLSSFFTNMLYSYKDRYILSGSLRYDGSTFVGNANQFTPLWNVSGRWNLHNEAFLDGSIVSLLALKGGYGYTGSIDRNASPYTLLHFNNANYKYDGQVLPNRIDYPSKNLKWQTKKDRNVGVEVGLWNNKLQIGVNYFDNITEDVLNLKKLAVSSGRSGIKANVASISNKGWEFDMTTTVYDRNDFTWILQANLNLLNDEIVQSFYPNLDDVAAKGQEYVTGYPVKGWYGYKFHSINPSDGHVYVIGDDGKPFDMKLTQNVTSNIQLPKASYLGDYTPSYYGGISTTLKYKQLSLRISGDYKGGHKIMSFGANDQLTTSRNKQAHILDSWTQPGDVTKYPRVDYFYSAFDTYMIDTELEDGDYFRINMISLGYMFKSELVNRIGLKSARLNFNVRNVATFSKYKGIDPSLLGALDYPNTRKYVMSLNIGF